MKKVLIVDDDPDDRQLIKDALEECRISVVAVELSDGSDVINYLNTCPTHKLPDLVLLDLNMPIMNGFDTLNEIRLNKKFSEIPVYVFTTSSTLEDKQHAISLGAIDFITKPSHYSGWIKSLCPLVDKREIA